MAETQTVRSPQEIRELYEEVKEKKEKEGRKYTTSDFLKDCGYVGHKQTFTSIIADPEKPHHRGISPSVNMLMDNMESKL